MLDTESRQMSEQLQQCIRLCEECHNICLETVSYCLQMGSQMSALHIEPGHMTLLMDCAEICQTSANFMLRASRQHPRTCAVCAEICDLCARSCEQFADDAQMRACADACRRCAESCRQMAGHTC